MPIDLKILSRRLVPENTMLCFGAGASIPSGAPSGMELKDGLCKEFEIADATKLTLSDVATVIEARNQRQEMVHWIRKRLERLQPARGVLLVPEFDWAGLYTTNYDMILEKAFERKGKPTRTIGSNFDFSPAPKPDETVIYKLHGTIGVDVSLGHQSRMVLSARDYDLGAEYRELIYSKFSEQLYSKDVVIVGQSLSDPDLKQLVDRAISLKASKGAPGTIYILAYENDELQTIVYESRGLSVCISGIDEFFDELATRLSGLRLLPGISDDPLDRAISVIPSTTSVSTAKANETGMLSKMFNGSPANYADIARGWTFERSFSERIETQLADPNRKRIAYILGPAGSGKTTGARKALSQLSDRGIHCWEHNSAFELQAGAWKSIDDELRERKQTGVLFIDDAHQHLFAINDLIDKICTEESTGLRLLMCSSSPNWNPRLKTPNLFSNSEKYDVLKLSEQELDSLLDLLDQSKDIRDLVERSFLGFTKSERRRRLAERCQSDTFVCLKNIFASERFDDILLREFGELMPDYQEVYRRIAGMQASGVRVHRQLVLRTTHIRADQVSRVLDDLSGIIEERTVDTKNGIYSWSVRHSVIADIIARYKLSGESEIYELLDTVVSNLNPTYPIELLSMDEVCSPQGGFSKIYDRRKQNILLRKMISLAPTRRVPRHRLITNLIHLNEFGPAETEIRLFENELRIDGPVHRYKVRLLVERAKQSEFLMTEDRAAITREACVLAATGVQRFSNDKNMFEVYLRAAMAYFKFSNDPSALDDALIAAESAYEQILDPELRRTIMHYKNEVREIWQNADRD